MFSSSPILLLFGLISLLLIGVNAQPFNCTWCDVQSDIHMKTPPVTWQLPHYAAHVMAILSRDPTTESYEAVSFGGFQQSGVNLTYFLSMTTYRFTFNPPSGLPQDTIWFNTSVEVINGFNGSAGSAITPLYDMASYNATLGNVTNVAFLWGGGRPIAGGALEIPARSDLFLQISPDLGQASFRSADVTSSIHPPSRVYHTVVYTKFYSPLGSALYFGGLSTIYHNDLWAFHFATSSWEEIFPQTSSPKPPGRQKHSAVLIDDVMYVFGGVQNEMNPPPMGDLWAFSLTTRIWTDLSSSVSGTFPSPRYDAMAATTTEKSLLIMGGVAPGTIFDNVFEFSPSKNRFSQICFNGQLPHRYASQVLTLADDHFLINGGVGAIMGGSQVNSNPRLFSYRMPRSHLDCPYKSGAGCISRYACHNHQRESFTACPPATPFECLVGNNFTCVATRADCPLVNDCDVYQEPHQCSNGQCASNRLICWPIHACAVGETRCADGRCANSCNMSLIPTCGAGQVMCADGCADTCEPFSGCPAGYVQCPNGRCDLSGSPNLCKDSILCPNGQYPCDDGNCASTPTTCTNNPPLNSLRFSVTPRSIAVPAGVSIGDQVFLDTDGKPRALIIPGTTTGGTYHIEPLASPPSSLLKTFGPLPRWTKPQRGVKARGDYFVNILSPIFHVRFEIPGTVLPSAFALFLNYPLALANEVALRGCLGYLNQSFGWQCATTDLTPNTANHASFSSSVYGTTLSSSYFYSSSSAPSPVSYTGIFALLRKDWVMPTLEETYADARTIPESEWESILAPNTILAGSLSSSNESMRIQFSLEVQPSQAVEGQTIINFFTQEYGLLPSQVQVSFLDRFTKKRALVFDTFIDLSTPLPSSAPTPSESPSVVPSDSGASPVPPSMAPASAFFPPPNIPPNEPASSSSSSETLIIGICVGVGIVLIIVIVTTVCCIMRKRKKKRARSTSTGMNSYATNNDGRGYAATQKSGAYTSSMISVNSRVRDRDYQNAEDPQERVLGPAASIYAAPSPPPQSSRGYQASSPPPPAYSSPPPQPYGGPNSYPAPPSADAPQATGGFVLDPALLGLDENINGSPPPSSPKASPPPPPPPTGGFVLDPSLGLADDGSGGPPPRSMSARPSAPPPMRGASQGPARLPPPPPPMQADPAPAPPPSGGFVLTLDMLPQDDQ